MKKRNLLLFSVPLIIGVTLATTWIALHWQSEKFESLSLDGLRQESEDRLTQSILFFQPLLEKKDLETLDRYCETFTKDYRSVAVFNIRGSAIVVSENADLRHPLEKPDVIAALRDGRNITVERNLKTGDWMISACAVVTVCGEKQLLRIVEQRPNVASVWEETASSILFLLATLPVLVFVVWYLVRRVVKPLDRLQLSAEKIASGNLNIAVEVPDRGAVRELALSVAEMAERLKKEVETVRRQEKFRRDFVSNVSHEIKTPLTGILSAIQILDDGGWNNPVYLSKCRDVLVKQTKRLQILVRDVLSLAELERLEENVRDFENVALDNIVHTAIRLCKETVVEPNSKTRLHLLRCDAAFVWGDTRLLEQAVLNLLSNAVRYGGDSDVEISLAVNDTQAVLTVCDHGPGIPEEWQDRIFERFFRLRREYGSRPDGTGLGLAIVKQIATLHNATIRLKKGDTQGACFIFSIDLVKDEMGLPSNKITLKEEGPP